ncbi:DUF2125 domain-containing protein [Limobrevibacterium gyesilva]|uniref:DUF945 domain-containing protein n=1 Tax=Limobrevibacterium gyesilva TaxID=2991712 RepID=A0AA42CH84_9PROT|nr:hypothetical protein [Limobrevibacterium gyesilva]MCW3476971.1 hypothetical protein [Limobrevibacterium gyesilva]
MSRAARLHYTVIALGLLAAPAARAEVTADQAQSLEQQIRVWFAGLAGPAIDANALPLRLTPDGDSFRVEFGPLPIPGVAITGGPVTASAKPLDGGRWSIYDMRLPSPMKTTMSGIKLDSVAAIPTAFTMTIAEQEMHAILDPGLATTSSYDGKLSGFSQVVEGPLGTQTTKIDRVTFHNTWHPTDGARQTVLSETTLEGYSSVQPMKEVGTLTITADRIRSSAGIEQADFGQLGRLIRTAASLAADVQAGANPSGKQPDAANPTPAQREAMRAMVVAMASLAASMDGEQVLEGLRVQAGDHGGRIAELVIGGGFAAPDGKADLHMKIAMTGLESPDIPPGAFRAFLPRHIALAPRVSGISKEDLVRFLLKAIDDAGQGTMDAEAEALALLADGPLTLGLDGLAIDLGTTKVTGAGELEVTSPAEITGAAELRASGLDTLIERASKMQETKTAVPVLLLLKGIGRQDGKEVVWKIAYEDNKVTVNGTDMSALVPGR